MVQVLVTDYKFARFLFTDCKNGQVSFDYKITRFVTDQEVL